MLAFVHLPKCAGTTLVFCLRRNFGLDHCDVIPRDQHSNTFSAADLRRLLALRPSLRSLSGHSVHTRSGLEEVVPDIRYYALFRDPVERYVSDFRHFVEVLNFPPDFEAWLDYEPRWNLQTRLVAGCDDAERAMQELERYALLGVAEGFDAFMEGLRCLAWSDGVAFDARFRTRNRAEFRVPGRRRAPPVDVEAHRQRIEAVNALDRRLYEHVRDERLPAQQERIRREAQRLPPALEGWGLRDELRERMTLVRYRLYRNLVLKPYLGYWPRPFRLPANRPLP